MRQDNIRWGILGPGIIAHEFAHDMKFVQSGDIVAVASRSRERAQDFAGQYDIPRAYNSYDELYRDKEIDAIYIATPHTFHLSQSIQAMENGKAVLCEKPITTSPVDLEELKKVSEATGQYLMEGMWTYFLPAIQKAQAWTQEGRIGKIRHVKSDFGYPVPFDPKGRMYNPELAGGALLDMGIYTIAMAWLFLQQDPKDISVITRKAKTGVNDDVTMLFEYDHAVANLTTSFRCKLNNWTYVIGEEGYIAIPHFWRARECYLYKLEECIETYSDKREGFGFQFEAEAVNQDLLNQQKQSSIVPHAVSMKLQDHMAKVSSHF